MFPSSSSLPLIPRVPATAAAADTVTVVIEVIPAGRDAESEALPPFSIRITSSSTVLSLTQDDLGLCDSTEIDFTYGMR